MTNGYDAYVETVLAEARRPAAEVCAGQGHDWSIVEVTRADRSGLWPIAVTCDRRCGHPGYQLVDVSA